MKNEIIHWFDADYTLWNTNAKWWIVDKTNPLKPIIKISQYEGDLILSGYYSKDNLPFSYNGKSGWIGLDLWQKIQRNKPVKIENIGLSFREYNDENLINTQYENLIVYIDRIQHIKGKRDIIKLLTSRGNKSAHKNILDKLKNKLLENDLILTDSIFVNDPTEIKFSGDNNLKKMICILECIVGYKIEKEEFIPIVTDSYLESYFYDDEDINIEICKKINYFIKKYLDNTQIWLRDKIKQSINIRKPKLFLNQITSNEINPYISTTVDIKILD